MTAPSIAIADYSDSREMMSQSLTQQIIIHVSSLAWHRVLLIDVLSSIRDRLEKVQEGKKNGLSARAALQRR